jgi:hypothetical protein
METKPYNLQSPEAIAKEYGGNKMKIAQAAQFGLLDPTAAVLAGMFIDRMRGAQQQEQAPQQTVAQQVLAPQPAAPQMPAGAGLGTTPEASQLAAAYPADGAPPPVPGPSMPQQQEPVMAADGGLMALPVDDSMFEPSYNSGGIVAFAAGSDGPVQSSIVDERERVRLRREMETRFRDNPGVMQNLAKMSPDDMRQALGEVTFNVIPSPETEVTKLEPSFSNSIDRDAMKRDIAGNVPRPNLNPFGTDAILGQSLLDPTKPEMFSTQPAPNRVGPTPENLARLQATGSVAPPVSDVYPDESVRGSRTSVAAPTVVDKGPAANVDAKPPTDAQVADAAIAADPKAAEAAAKKGGIPGLQAYVQQYKDLIGAVPEGEGLKEYKEYLKGLPGELDKRKKEDLYGALAQFGFNLAGSQSPYFLQAAGQAGAQTMPAITGAIKERRGAEAEARKGRAELDKMTRAEEIKAIEGGAKLYSDDETRKAQERAALASANKPTDMRSYVNDYVAAARARGDKETPEAVLRQMGTETYLKLYSASEVRARAAASQAATAETQAQTNLQDRARDNVDGSLSKNYNSPENKEIRRLQKEDRRDGTNKAQTYVDGLYKKEEDRLRGPQSAPAPAPAPAPAANAAATSAPASAAASSKGKFEVKAPNGKTYYFPTKEAADAFAKSFGTK